MIGKTARTSASMHPFVRPVSCLLPAQVLVGMLALCPPAAIAAHTIAVNFTGRLLAGTCDVRVGDDNQTIALPSVRDVDLVVGQAAGETPFEIGVVNCVGTSRVAFTFSGTADPVAVERWRNEGTALNVAVGLGPGRPICNADSGSCSKTVFVDVAGGTAVLPVSAHYWPTGTPGAGTVRAVISVTMAYQ